MAACPEAGQLGALTRLRPVRRQSPSLEPGASQEAGGAALPATRTWPGLLVCLAVAAVAWVQCVRPEESQQCGGRA